MTDGIRLLQFRQHIPAHDYELLKSRRDFKDHVHRTASRALADRIIRDAAFQVCKEEPDADDLWGGTRATLTFSIPIGDRSEAGEMARQLDQARAEGMRMAADMARAAAGRYSGLAGGCAGVIASALHRTASEIEVAAEHEVSASVRRGLTPQPPAGDG